MQPLLAPQPWACGFWFRILPHSSPQLHTRCHTLLQQKAARGYQLLRRSTLEQLYCLQTAAAACTNVCNTFQRQVPAMPDQPPDRITIKTHGSSLRAREWGKTQALRNSAETAPTCTASWSADALLVIDRFTSLLCSTGISSAASSCSRCVRMATAPTYNGISGWVARNRSNRRHTCRRATQLQVSATHNKICVSLTTQPEHGNTG